MNKRHCDRCDATIVLAASPYRYLREPNVTVRCLFSGPGSQQLELCESCAEGFIGQAFQAAQSSERPR